MAAAPGGIALSFGTWLGTIEVTLARGEREVKGPAGGRNLRLLEPLS